MARSLGDCTNVRTEDELYQRWSDCYMDVYSEQQLKQIHRKWVDIVAGIWSKKERNRT